jgi:hypothetical protein
MSKPRTRVGAFAYGADSNNRPCNHCGVKCCDAWVKRKKAKEGRNMRRGEIGEEPPRTRREIAPYTREPPRYDTRLRGARATR